MTVDKYGIREACEKLGVEPKFVVRCIRARWIRPAGPAFELDEEDVARVGLVRELQENLGVNDDSVPIILDLIDRLHFLENRLRRAGRRPVLLS
jgi:chaperone modulatory protein CbpM